MALLVVLFLLVSATSSYASSTSEPWLDPRLPKSLRPIHYDLFIQPHIFDREFNGRVSIEIKVLIPTKFIIVHSLMKNVTRTRVFVNETSVTLNRASPHEPNSYWVVETVESMMTADMVKLELEFRGYLNFLVGITKTGFTDENTGRYSPMVVTTFNPIYARMGFPNFDEPFYKARFTITLRHWNNLTAVSNMPEYSVRRIDSDWQETKFKKTPLISSFAVGFVITEHVSRNNTLIDGKPLRVWVRREREQLVGYTLKISRIVYGFLNRELGNISSLPKIDQIAIPFSFSRGGHSNWGLINHNENRLTFNSTIVGDKHRQRELAIIATELARNYFGLLVTCEYWNHVWLHSGLARLYGLKAAASVESVSLEEQELKEQGMYDDAFNYSRPLITQIADITAEPDVYSLLLRSKGAAVLKMMENFLGDQTFKRGIKRYIELYSFKTSLTRDLFATIQSVADANTNISEIMKTWCYSMGFPVITIRLLSGNRISATQKRFLLDPLANPNHPPSTHGYKWYVPLNYRTKRGSTGRVWLNKTTDAVFDNLLNANDNWILFNNDQSGYYRINYERQLWNNIIEQLKNGHTVLTEQQRSQLLSDALHIATAEQLGFDVALNLTMYAANERFLTSWSHIYDALGNINQMLSNSSDYRRYQRYVLNITTNVMNELKVVDEGTFEEKLLREKIISLSCSAGHRGCIANTTRLFKAWIQNEKLNVIPVNIRRLVYCHAIANSASESEWNTTFARLLAMKELSSESKSLMSGLACTKNLTLVNRILEASLSNNNASKIWFDELTTAAREFSVNPKASIRIWEWLKVNRAQIEARFYTGASADLAHEVTFNFNTEELFQEVRNFFAGMNSTETNRPIRLTKKRISANLRWIEKQLPTLSSWLQQTFSV